jgi:undecaprenyl-diphosphatase
MDIIQAIILGILQGATEFIPVSSSGHLVLVPWLLGWDSPTLVFDTVVHWGTLVAVLAYFRNDWMRLIAAWLRSLRGRGRGDSEGRLMWLLIAGTIPAAAIGYAFEGMFESLFSAPAWVSFFLLVTAALLTIGERLGQRTRDLDGLRLADALLIGIMQAAAIAPGISRSGATTSQGMLLGLKRDAAARFSFLLATPIILGAGVFQLLDLIKMPDPLAQLPVLGIGLAAAAITGYLCIWALLRYLQRGTLHLFAVYCGFVGVTCLIVSWLR